MNNVFIYSQFRLEENFFKCVIFFKCIFSFIKLKKTIYIHCTLPACSKLSLLLLFSVLEYWGRVSFARAVQSAMLNMRRCFCNLVTARATSLRCENKQQQLYTSEKKKKEFAVCKMKFFYSQAQNQRRGCFRGSTSQKLSSSPNHGRLQVQSFHLMFDLPIFD